MRFPETMLGYRDLDAGNHISCMHASFDPLRFCSEALVAMSVVLLLLVAPAGDVGVEPLQTIEVVPATGATSGIAAPEDWHRVCPAPGAWPGGPAGWPAIPSG